MGKVNKRVIIAAFAVMLIMTITVAILSFSLADNNDNTGSGTTDVEAASNTKTNIDRIIETATSTDADVDTVYHIVEIGSGSPSALQSMVTADESGKTIFQELVINANRTIDGEMPDGKIDYTFYSVADLNSGAVDLTEALQKMSQADFIYVNNQPGNQYSQSNDLPEDVYTLLHTFAVGDYKPMMIDSPTETEIIEKQSSKTVGMLVTNLFEVYGSSRYTFNWNSTNSAEDFFNHRNDSMYLPMHGDTLSSNWLNVENNGNNETIATILTIVRDETSTNTTLTDMVKNGLTEPCTLATASDAAGNEVTLENTYVLSAGSDLYNYGYNAREIRPTYVRFETVSMDETEDMDLSGYDMIIMEADCGASSIISDAVYNKLAGVMYANQHLVYDSSLVSGTSDDTTGEVNNDTNYAELFYMVATSKEIARYSNILVTNQDQVNMFAAATSGNTMAPIVSIINAGAYRGIGGQGNASTMYTVLELQPSYPIDEELALRIATVTPREGSAASYYGEGNYYTDPDSILNGTTLDEISDEYQEYYAWELSKAKIAHVTGIPYDQINLVQMSTEEFICNKDTLIDTYDLIYIGGNNSAIKDIDYFIMGRIFGWGSEANIRNLVPTYNMYYHNGDLYTFYVGGVNSSGGLRGGAIYGNVTLNGTTQDSFGVQTGNDLTQDKLDELIEYVNAGMPIVFSKDVSEAYDNAVVQQTEQHLIDPESKMYEFLTHAKELEEAGNSNILWNFDNEKTVQVENVNGKYGLNTVKGYATVFAGKIGDSTDYLTGVENTDGDAQRLADLITTSNQRPKLVLTSMPSLYDQNNDDSILTSGKLKFKYEITGSSTSYNLKLYIDDDGNSLFSEDEVFRQASGGASGTFEYELSSSFYGPVYWKFEVTDSNGEACASYSGLSKVANPDPEAKQLVQVLQIMPHSGQGAEGMNTLYLCTECQQAYQILQGNPWSDATRGSFGALYGGNYEDSINDPDYPRGKSLTITRLGTNSLGYHEHKFGIVKYDSTLTLENGSTTITGIDDWDVNLADELSDDYDFKLDIVTEEQFEEMCQEVYDAYNFTEAEAESIVQGFTMEDDDPDKEEYDAMTTMEKAIYITSRQYLERSSDYWQLYNFMREEEAGASTVEGSDLVNEEISGISKTTKTAAEELEDCIQRMIDNVTNSNARPYGLTASELRDELQRLLDTDKYYDYYSIGTSRYNELSGAILGNGETIDTYFVEWRNAKNKELSYYDSYIENLRLSSVTGEDRNIWDIYETYSAVVIGAAEDFGGEDIEDIGTEALLKYVEQNGTMVLFHDTMSKFADTGSVNLTDDLRAALGMDARHMEIDEEELDSTGLVYADTQATISVAGMGSYTTTISKSTSETRIDMQAQATKLDSQTVYFTGAQQNWGAVSYTISGNTNSIDLSARLTSWNNTLFDSITENSKDETLTDIGTSTINLYCYSNSGTPVSGMRVYMCSSGDSSNSSNIIATATTDTNGLAVFSLNNYSVNSFDATVTRTGDSTETGSNIITVNVIDPNGNPVSGRSINVSMNGNNYSGTTDNEGTASILIDSNAFSSVDTSSYSQIYLPYKTVDGYDSSEYYISPLSKFTSDPTSMWLYRYQQVNNNYYVSANKYLSAIALTPIVAIGESASNTNAGGLMYKYADVAYANMAYWAYAASNTTGEDANVKFGTNRATQNNEGIVTSYPFKISSRLNISGTHNQTFVLDVEDEDLVVWYSLAGGTNGKDSSIYAASPNDGADNYFIYSYKGITYCGAGHSKVTGIGKDNNDERMLYINIICNSVRNSAKMPTINVYDYNQGEKLGDFIKVDADGSYYAKVDDMNAIPTFAYKATTDEETEITNVKIYYDLDYLTNQTGAYTNDANHILIFESNYDPANNVASGLLKQVDTSVARNVTINGELVTALQLRPEYFDPYNQEYTYIVIAVTDTEGNTVYQRIKIMMTQYLHDLT